jgi:hypothetical protein
LETFWKGEFRREILADAPEQSTLVRPWRRQPFEIGSLVFFAQGWGNGFAGQNRVVATMHTQPKIGWRQTLRLDLSNDQRSQP